MLTKVKNIDTFLKELTESYGPQDQWIFDCDGTLIDSDIATHTTWKIIKDGLIDPSVTPEELNNFDLENFTYKDFKMLKKTMIERRKDFDFFMWEMTSFFNLKPEQMSLIAQQALELGVSNETINYSENMKFLINNVKPNAWIISGSPKRCVKAIADKYEIPTQKIFATEIEDSNGVLTKEVKAKPGVVWQKVKETLIIENITKSPYFVAGDSIGDLEMLKLSKKYAWCVSWGEKRHRGDQFREILFNDILEQKTPLPTEPGIYLLKKDFKTWIIEIK